MVSSASFGRAVENLFLLLLDNYSNCLPLFSGTVSKMATSEAEKAGSLNLIMAVSDSYSSYSTIVLQCVGLQGMKVM